MRSRTYQKKKAFSPNPVSLLQPKRLKIHQAGTPAESLAQMRIQRQKVERAGNHLFGKPVPVQTKLTVGAPGDKYEQEADAVASQVVQQINSPTQKAATAGGAVQREEMKEEEEPVQAKLESSVQREAMPEEEERETMPEEEEELVRTKLESSVQRETMPEEEGELETMPEEEEPVQAKSLIQRRGEAAPASANVESSIAQAQGKGQPMEASIKEPMEDAFGADFSGVRVHTDSQSDQLNRSLNSRAFTTGQDVFFRQGAYDPGSSGGQELFAHELTHVVQQSGGNLQRKKSKN